MSDSKQQQSSPPEDRPVPLEDPITTSSLATPIAIFSLLLMLTLVWALYDEVLGLRPWIGYQNDFVEAYGEALAEMKPLRAQEEAAIHASEGYQELQQALQQAEDAIATDLAEIEQEERILVPRLAAINKPFTTARSRLQAAIYLLETAGESSKLGLEEDLEELRTGPYLIEVPEPDGTRVEKSYTFGDLEEEFNDLKELQGELQGRTVELLRRPTQLRRELNTYANARLTSITEAQVEGLQTRLDSFPVTIKQIHNAEMGLVDRCESCHAGVRGDS